MKVLVEGKKAGLLPIFCAMIYDSLLIIACIMGLGFVAILLNRGQAIEAGSLGSLLLRIAMFALWALFYSFFISRQGQTLGMRAWRLVLVNQKQNPPRFWQALWRWAVGVLILWLPFALGLSLFPEHFKKSPWQMIFLLLPIFIAYIWRYIDPKSRTLIDLISGSQLWRVKQNPYPKTAKEKSC